MVSFKKSHNFIIVFRIVFFVVAHMMTNGLCSSGSYTHHALLVLIQVFMACVVLWQLHPPCSAGLSPGIHGLCSIVAATHTMLCWS